MAKGFFAGITDYSYQSLSDIKSDLQNESILLSQTVEEVERNIRDLKKSGYWDEKVNSDFKNITLVSLHHYRTAIEEIDDIVSEIPDNVEEHHCLRLKRVSEFADGTNKKIGKVWNSDYLDKEYSNSEFRKVEKIYTESRDAAASLLDIDNISDRLLDFIGKSPSKVHGKCYKIFHNPWIVTIGGGLILAFILWLISNINRIAL